MAEHAQMKVSDEVAIAIHKMNKWYGTFHVLRDIDLEVKRGERIVICGPSGSGKSTLVNETLYRSAAKKIYRAHAEPAEHHHRVGLSVGL